MSFVTIPLMGWTGGLGDVEARLCVGQFRRIDLQKDFSNDK